MNYREQHPLFIYKDYQISEGKDQIDVIYTYQIDSFVFTPNVKISKKNIKRENFDSAFLDYLVFHFGMINAINYYKLTLSPKMKVECGFLEDEQKEFFRKLYFYGLAEMMYKNDLNISYREFLEIETIQKEYPKYNFSGNYIGNLIPVGGGKDSIVTLELLKEDLDINHCFMYQRDIYPTDKASLETIQVAGYEESKIAFFHVTLDPLMLELNKKGFYNGHVPLSASLAFSAYLMAYLMGKEYVVLSNEASANEGNVEGRQINHQYSKSFEFEKDFRNYTMKYLNPNIKYFSLLRCWNEFRIVKEFVKHPQYFPVFRSCNLGVRKNVWCCNCSKCLYVYIMLYPFLTLQELDMIFPSNMLENEKYKSLLLELINVNYDKPFECVGTKEEVDYALKLAVEKTRDHLPTLLQFYKDNFYDPHKKYEVEDYFNQENFIAEKFIARMVI